ncbi:MAG: EamA family transporter [bacterium]|nr:MAG: EamA family transporter [bacterium]
MQNSQNQRKAYLLTLLTVLFWSTISSAFKITLRYLSFDNLLFWSVLSGIFVLGILNQSGKSPLRFRLLSRKAWLSSALMGFFNPFLYYLVLIKAYQLLEAQVAGTLNYIWPIVLVLLSILFLGQKIKARAVVAIFISFFGILIISTGGHPFLLKFSNPLGVVLAVGSALFWAVYWILNMKDPREESGKILLNMIFGLFYLMIYFGVLGRWPVVPSTAGLLGSLYIGTFEMSLTFVIWLKALTFSADTAKVSNLIYLSPFLGLFWISRTVGEIIHVYTLVGLTFIVGGILLQQWQKITLPERGEAGK